MAPATTDEEGRGDGADEFADVGLPVFDGAFDGSVAASGARCLAPIRAS